MATIRTNIPDPTCTTAKDCSASTTSPTRQITAADWNDQRDNVGFLLAAGRSFNICSHNYWNNDILPGNGFNAITSTSSVSNSQSVKTITFPAGYTYWELVGTIKLFDGIVGGNTHYTTINVQMEINGSTYTFTEWYSQNTPAGRRTATPNTDTDVAINGIFPVTYLPASQTIETVTIKTNVNWVDSSVPAQTPDEPLVPHTFTEYNGVKDLILTLYKPCP